MQCWLLGVKRVRYEVRWSHYIHSHYCNHSIGMQTVRSLPFYRLPSPGAPAPDFWCATVLPSASEKWLAAPDLTSLID